MAKSRSRKYQEQQTWKAFSKYIRARDAIRTTGTLARVVCFTCGNELETAASQAGHIISRSYSNALLNPNVVFAQCTHCNYAREGNHVLGFLNLVELVGYEKAQRIVYSSMIPKSPSYTQLDLEDMEDSYWQAYEILEQYYEEHAH